MFKLINCIVFSTIVIMITACGGNGNGDDNGDPNNFSSPDITLNQNITGHILSVERGWLWKMNLSTRQYTKVPNSNWEESGAFHNFADFHLTPSAYDGNELILAVRSCLPEDKITSCIITLDKNGVETNRFVIEGRIRGSAKVSRDGKYIAVANQYGSSITNDTYLEIYDRAGNIISDDAIGDTGVTLYFDWLPDGRLVYTKNFGDERTLYFTASNSANVEQELSIPPTLPGTLREVSVSPDGSQIAFGVVNDGSSATTKAIVLVVNADGTNIRQLASDPHLDNEESYINDPKWSHDGNWILVKYRGRVGSTTSDISGLGYLFAVPSDGVNVPLSPFDDSIESDAIQIESLWYAAFFEEPGSTINSDRWPNMDYDWIP